MSGYHFSIRHVAEMAMQAEERGYEFYSELARFTDVKESKAIFSALAEAEQKHKEFFRGIVVAFGEEEEREYSVDLNAMMKVHVDKLKEVAFNLPASLKKNFSGMQDALLIAINTELESIRIYTEISSVFSEKFRKPLQLIVDEEKKHLEMLQSIKARLVSKGV